MVSGKLVPSSNIPSRTGRRTPSYMYPPLRCMWKQVPPYTAMVGVPIVDLTSRGTTILLYFISTPSRKCTPIRTRGRNWRGLEHAKDHFQRMSGINISHLRATFVRFMWRDETQSNIYQSFFQSLNTIYTLSVPPVYTYPTPGLDSTAQLGEWEIRPYFLHF